MENQKRVFSNLIKIAIAVIILRSFYLQVIRHGHYYFLSAKNCIRTIETGTPRGFIYDRNKRVLARDIPSLELVFIPYDVESDENNAEILADIVNIDKTAILKRLRAKYSNPFNRVILKKRLAPEEVALIEENAGKLKGIFIQEGLGREYPLGLSTVHLLGYTGEISERQLSYYKGGVYKPGDIIGQDGIESAYDQYLRGAAGGIQVEVDARGYHRKVLGKKQSVPGSDLVLTIDQTIQEIVDEELGRRHGCIVVMDPRNGQILSLVSKPGFDPENIQPYFSSGGHPFLNRAIKGQYSPGSVFKIITAISALETGNIAEYDRIECTGFMEAANREFHCWKEDGHGWVDIMLALPFSCNIFFGTVGMRVGVPKMIEFARMFELGKVTGIDLPGEKSGFLPDRSLVDPLNLSIGQGPILTTPIQLVSFISTIANGGNIWKPYIVQAVIAPSGKMVKEIAPSIKKTVFISSETMGIVKRGLKNVMVFGTGASGRVEGIEIAGKTGTVQLAHRELELGTQGFFVCYAPAEEPKIAIVVFLDSASGPESTIIAGRIVKRIFMQEQKRTVEMLDTEEEAENVEIF